MTGALSVVATCALPNDVKAIVSVVTILVAVAFAYWENSNGRPDLAWIVIGTGQENRYDMARVAAVVDAGGDDEYYATGLRLGCRMIIDLEGEIERLSGKAD